MYKILIAEDEKDIRQLLLKSLQGDYEVHMASNGYEALCMFEQSSYDLIIADVVMPIMDGYTFIEKVREKSEVGVMFLTSRGESFDKVHGLKLGGDDYMVKPFELAELKARIEALLRRSHYSNQNNKSLECGVFYLNPSEYICKVKDKTIELSPKLYKLLEIFISHPNRVYTKKQLYDMVWQEDYMYDANTIMVHMSQLRQRVDPEKKYFQTIKGIGYKFKDDDHD
jgi:DNA-binding response OmpR family regulator